MALSKLPSSIHNLSRAQVRTLSSYLKSKGRKLPKVGWCQRLDDGREVCHDGRGYFIAGMTKWNHLPR